MDVSDRPGEAASLQLLRERCDFAYRRLVPAAAGTLAVSVILSAFLWRSEAPEVVLSWQTLMVEQMFVGIIVITILGVLSTLFLHECERLLIPWRRD